MELNIQSVTVDSDSKNRLQLRVIAIIEDDNGNNIKYKIKNEDGKIIDQIEEYKLSPIKISKVIFLEDVKFKNSNSYITIEAENDLGSINTIRKDFNLYDIYNLERTKLDEFSWKVKNFSPYSIYTMVEIVNKEKELMTNSLEYRMDSNKKGTSNYRSSINLKDLEEGEYYYRIRYYSKDENWNRYYPDDSGIKFIVRNNENPRVRLKDIVLLEEKSTFKLTGKVIISDEEEDRVKYNIKDNLGNTLKEMINFDYTPRIDFFEYEYPKTFFNTSKLIITVNVFDEIYGNNSHSYQVDLFSIDNLRRVRDHFVWKFKNRSNRNISMQPEVLDFYNQIVKVGEVNQYRGSYNFINIEDAEEFAIQKNYYKFRLKVWSEEDNWSTYYPNEEGIQFTRYPHLNPIITLNEAYLMRDLDDTRFLILNADITDPENDHILFTVLDEEGTIIREARDYIETPYNLNLKEEYTVDASGSNIVIYVIDDKGGEATLAVRANSFIISSLRERLGHIFSWKLDNFSRFELITQLEILEHNLVSVTDEEGNTEEEIEINTVYLGNENRTGETLRPVEIKDRIRPKLKQGEYYYRIRIISEEEDLIQYYPNEEGIKFTTIENTKPIITTNSIGIETNEDDETVINYNGIIEDNEDDMVTYSVTDSKGNIIEESKEYVETPLKLETYQKYPKDDIRKAYIDLFIECIDEGNEINSIIERVYMFDIQNLYRDYNEFYWLIRNLSSSPINIQAEILNNSGDLDGLGKVFTISNQTEYKELMEEIDFNDYDNGDYFFRLRVFTEEEQLVSYYPSINGIPFKLENNHKPDITNFKVEIDSTENESEYKLDVSASVSDKDYEKVYYIIKD
ncbi:hypothetical protein Bp8pS_027 [Bacillus phage vB_BpuM-BpSp]|nr:hypothetical protein Bp8pS_027 [Bacillus phage vB_BpuM-BpSp]